jgi:hypothetical protein
MASLTGWRPLLPPCPRFMRLNARSILLVFPAVSIHDNGIEGCVGPRVSHPQCVESARIERSPPIPLCSCVSVDPGSDLTPHQE